MPLTHLELVAVSGRKSRFDVGLAYWRRPQRRISVGSFVCGDMVGSLLLSFDVRRCPLLILCGAMYAHRWCLQEGASLRLEQVPLFTCHFLLGAQSGWCVDKRCSMESGGLRRYPASVETRCVCQLRIGSSVL
ncbi:hypothetical protein VPH35_021668 [Triticum aestivum]